MKTNDKEQGLEHDTNSLVLENFLKEAYRPISDEELATWSAEIIDRYFYRCSSFEEFKAACKEVFEVDDVTEEDFKSFVKEFETTYTYKKE